MTTNNPLDPFDLVTYNFKLEIENPLGGARRTLVESAKSPYYIDDVNINSVVAPNTSTATSLAIEFDFVIKEPNGAYFLQFMQEQAKAIGVDNYLKTNFYLTLTFPASTSVFRESMEDMPNIPSMQLSNVSTPIEWKIVIINCDVSIDSTGSTYNMKGVTAGQVGTSNQYGMINESVSIEADNINSFFEQLSEQLKEMKRHEHAAHRDSSAPVDEYEFIFSEAVVGDGDFIPEKAQEEMSSFNDATYDEESWDEVAIHISENIEIPRLIDMAITSTEHFQKVVKNSLSPDENEHKDYDSKQFYIIIPTVETLGYDHNRQDYVRKFTYEVKPYEKVLMKAQPREEDDEENITKVYKHYEYIFTGRNVDVISLDVNFNFGGVIPMSKQSGVTTTQASTVVGARGRNEETEEDLQENVEKLDTLHGSSIGTPSWEVGDVINTYVVSPVDHQSDYGLPSQRHEGRKLAANYWMESLESRGENMLEIELEIRGDPDWLRETREEEIEGDMFFSLYIKSPRPTDIENEWTQAANMTVLMGYYQMLQLTSSFSNGMFTQRIKGIKATRKRFNFEPRRRR